MAAKHRTTYKTALQIQALPKRPAKYDAYDANRKGLRVRVSPSGSKSFRWPIRKLNKTITLGLFSYLPAPGHLTLDDAHDWFDKLRIAHRGGADALEAKVKELHEALGRRVKGSVIAVAPAPGGMTVADLAAEFKSDVLSGRKRPDEAIKMVDALILVEGFKSRPLAQVEPPEISALVKAYVKSGAPARAAKLLGLLKQMFTHGQGNGYIVLNPAAPLKPKALGIVTGQGSRCLDHPRLPHRGEIRLFWQALEAKPTPARVERPDPRTGKVQVYEQRAPSLAPQTRIALKLLLLLGVRSGELLRATWDEIDLNEAVWTVPISHQKLTRAQEEKAVPWRVPLPATAVDLFRELQALAKGSPFVMASHTSDKTGGPQSFDERALSHALRRLQAGPRGGLKLPGGRVKPHDLRRSFRTGLSKIGIRDRDIRERCLNHRIEKVEDTYDGYDFLDERRAALTRWEAYLLREVTGQGAEVIAIPAPAAVGA